MISDAEQAASAVHTNANGWICGADSVKAGDAYLLVQLVRGGIMEK